MADDARRTRHLAGTGDACSQKGLVIGRRGEQRRIAEALVGLSKQMGRVCGKCQTSVPRMKPVVNAGLELTYPDKHLPQSSSRCPRSRAGETLGPIHDQTVGFQAVEIADISTYNRILRGWLRRGPLSRALARCGATTQKPEKSLWRGRDGVLRSRPPEFAVHTERFNGGRQAKEVARWPCRSRRARC